MMTRRHVHEISKDGALYYLLNGFNGALNKLAEQIGGGLRAIALALSTPQDNSSQVQAELDKIQARLKSQTDALEGAVKSQPKGD